MAHLIRRNQGGAVAPSRGFDPFEMVRDLMRWDPFADLVAAPGALGGFVPSFEVEETKDDYVFRADLPGVREEDLDISLTGTRLTVSGRREEEKREEDDRHYAYERSHGSFSRSFTLPEGVDPDRAQGELGDGVLTIHVAKRPAVKPERIEVEPSAKGEKARA